MKTIKKFAAAYFIFSFIANVDTAASWPMILKNETTASKRRISIVMVDDTDGVTAETELSSFTVRVTKNGVNAAGGGSVSEVDSANDPGMYYYEATESEVDTSGTLIVYATHSGAQPYRAGVNIVDADSFMTDISGVSTFDSSTETVNLSATTEGQIDDIDTASASCSTHTAADVWDEICETEGALTCGEMMSLGGAVLYGVTDNSTNPTFKTSDGSETRVVAVVNTDNERTSISLTPSE